MGVGISNLSGIEPSVKEEIAKKRVNEAAEKYGLDIEGELNNIETGYLPGANAATFRERNGASVVFDNQNFFNKSKTEQELTTLHELLHVKQFNGSLGEWLQTERDASDEFVQELDTGYKTVSDLEGEVEIITDKIFPNSLPSSYPYERASKQTELEQKGFDLEEELFNEAKQEVEEEYSSFSDIYDFAIGEGFYYETGNIEGIEYEFMAIGGKAGIYGSGMAESYRQSISDHLEPAEDMEESGIENYFEAEVMKDFGDYWGSLEKVYDEQAEYIHGYDSIEEVSEMITPKTTPAAQALDTELGRE